MRSWEFLQKACSYTDDLEGQAKGEGLGLGQCVTPGLPSSGCFRLRDGSGSLMGFLGEGWGLGGVQPLQLTNSW